jgi:hypothetical protein
LKEQLRFCGCFHRSCCTGLKMLVLKITNASEVVAAKIGRFLEMLTPDALDEKTVEDVLIKELIKNLSAEGLKGEVAAVRGLELHEHGLEVDDGLHVRHREAF